MLQLIRKKLLLTYTFVVHKNDTAHTSVTIDVSEGMEKFNPATQDSDLDVFPEALKVTSMEQWLYTMSVMVESSSER